MSVTFRYHDLLLDPSPPLPPAAGGASLVAEVVVSGVELPGPDLTHDSGFRVLAAPGSRALGTRRDLVLQELDLVWPHAHGDEVADLSAFYRLAEGLRRSFYVTFDAEDLWPLAPFPGATVLGGAPLTPSATLYPWSAVRLAAGTVATFTRAWFNGPLAIRQQARPSTAPTQDQWFGLGVPLRLELASWGA